MNYSKIKIRREEVRLTYKEFCTRIGLTEGGFSRTILKESMSVSTLEKVCEVLQVPIGYFFDEELVHTSDNKKCMDELFLSQKKIIELQSIIIKLQEASNKS